VSGRSPPTSLRYDERMGLISLFVRIGLVAAADSGPKTVTKEEG
jgi:hypothetical protein